MSSIPKNQILSLMLSLCLLGLQNGSARAQIIPMAMWNKPAAPVNTGPTPNPMTFAVVPAGASTSSSLAP